MSNIKDVQQIQALIAEGKKKGFLTFDELNKALPSEVNTPEQIEEIIVIFDQLDIDIVDEKLSRGIEIAEDDGEEPKEEEKLELAEDEDGADYSSRSNDPVRMYLREMGAVGLLDRDGEVYIAKKIEAGELEVMYALVEVPVAVEELVRVGEDLKKGRMKLKDVVKTIEEDDPSEEEMNQRERVIKLLEDVKNIYRKKKPLYTRSTSARRWISASSACRRRSWTTRKALCSACATSSLRRPSSTASSRPSATTCARCTTAARPFGLHSVAGQIPGRDFRHLQAA
jgi:RNA polymerase primary sigma factor